MKKGKELRAASYVAGLGIIASALLLVVYLILTIVGAIHPRQQRLMLYTPDLSKVYDGISLSGSRPEIEYGQLHEGHTLEIIRVPQHSRVGQYENAPEYRIMDQTGADVTEQYDIQTDFGTITIQARQLAVLSMDKSKVYDGKPLTADPVTLIGGTLAPGHQLMTQEGNSILYPGTVPIEPAYQIISEDGIDVTDQYAVYAGESALTVRPRPLILGTGSAEKCYDGKDLTASDWTHLHGELLEGHCVQMEVTAVRNEVGIVPNEGVARVVDENGDDVSSLYDIQYEFGTLQVQPIPLYIRTGSARKVYDGKPLECPEWELTGGNLEPGASIVVQSATELALVGTVDNEVRLSVLDADGRDITARYRFICDYGTLDIQPRAITIRTGSAQKVYDGTPLQCQDFELIQGSLCEGEWIELLGVSIAEVGYSENFVLDCSVYKREADGVWSDLSACYRLTFEFGTLRITTD